jgi:hypothetical protein
MDNIRLPEKLNEGWYIGYNSGMPTLYPYSLNSDYIAPDLDNLFDRLKNPDYLNYKLKSHWLTERACYLRALSYRNDLTETHKRLLKMYQAKL